MEIRTATPQDVANIAELYIKNHTETYQGLLPEAYFSRLTPDHAREKWTAYLQDRDRVLWTAYEAGEFLGFAAGMRDPELADTWYLDSLHITPGARGKGIGTALINRMKAYASQKNYTRMSVCIVRGNETAGRLYQRLGAEHLTYFQDDFCGTPSNSEKLIWPHIGAPSKP